MYKSPQRAVRKSKLPVISKEHPGSLSVRLPTPPPWELAFSLLFLFIYSVLLHHNTLKVKCQTFKLLRKFVGDMESFHQKNPAFNTVFFPITCREARVFCDQREQGEGGNTEKEER